ncbi:hypothetical protein STCU_06784 [Strigomonas culicis]|uniref:Uncharacterized protein n=1 Tax=Strigomonas culicis TaxID=28005 RepID=S9U347_9TRYP|nr:hypothetical protein STCU_06784 [Strigomonas culicis]|eukprot:EPY25217.1 hypothetical protein STCU_06784 [Strigomonas culicis]
MLRICHLHDIVGADGFASYAISRSITSLRNKPDLEEGIREIANIAIASFTELCTNVRDQVEKMVQSPADEDKILAALCGVPLKSRAHDLCVVHVERTAISLAKALFTGRVNLGTSRKLLPIFNQSVKDFVNVCQEFNVNVLDKVVNVVTFTLNSIFLNPDELRVNDETRMALESDRKEFFNSDSAGPETLDMLCGIMVQLQKAGHLKEAWTTMKRIKDMSTQLLEHRSDKSSYVKAYRVMADLLWTCGKHSCHAHCMFVAATLDSSDSRALVATSSILSVLCCTDKLEDSNPFDSSRDTDIEGLFDEHVTTKEYLLAHLGLHQKDLVSVAPEAWKLLQDFTNPSFTNYAQLFTSMESIVGKSKKLERYEPLLRRNLLRRQLVFLSEQSSSVEVDKIPMGALRLSDDNYLNELVPILSDESIPIELDCKTRSIFFRNATKAKMVKTFVQLSHQVDVRPAAKRTAGPAFCRPSSETGLEGSPVTSKDILAASSRSRLLHSLEMKCRDTINKRRTDRENAEKEEKVKKVNERMEIEKVKREKANLALEKKQKSKRLEEERQKRAVQVMSRLRVKYPGIKLDDKLAMRSASAFENELTALVADFERQRLSSEKRDMIRTNLVEQAIRRMEIPKRAEYDKANAERRSAEVTAARENFLAQHKEEFEKRQHEKEVLRKFLGDAMDFENKMRDSTKASKREVQESLLEQEKRRLAGER